jgi:hypothetical protein
MKFAALEITRTENGYLVRNATGQCIGEGAPYERGTDHWVFPTFPELMSGIADIIGPLETPLPKPQQQLGRRR